MMLTKGEIAYLSFQIGHASKFESLLFQLIAAADNVNRSIIRLSFPGEVAAYESWIKGDLAERVGRRKGEIIEALITATVAT